MTQDQATENVRQLNLLNNMQRNSLRNTYGHRTIHAISTELWEGTVDWICITFKMEDDQLIQYSGFIGKRGSLKDITCMGFVPDSI